MADSLSIASGIVGFMSLVDTVLQQLSRLVPYIDKVDPYAEMRRLQEEQTRMERTLEKIRTSFSADTPEKKEIMFAAKGCMLGVTDLLNVLRSFKRASLPTAGSFRRHRAVNQQKQLIEKETEIRRALYDLQRTVGLTTAISREPYDTTKILARSKTAQTRDSRPVNAISEKGGSRGFVEEPQQISGIQEKTTPLYEGPWSTKRILCLGGNEIEAMACLYVLLYLMERIIWLEQDQKRWSKADSSSTSPLYPLLHSYSDDFSRTSEVHYQFRPCHYFDYICGSGLGGMAAIMLGVMRFSVPEVIQRCKSILDLQSPSTSYFISTSRLIFNRRKNSDQLKKNCREQLEQPAPTFEKNAGPEAKWQESQSYQANLQTDEHFCQTICVTALQQTKGIQYPYILRSYNLAGLEQSSRTSLRNGSRDTWGLSIVDACMASVPVPLHCDSATVKDFGKFKDASLLEVNPAWEVYNEVGNLYHAEQSIGSLVYINSVETVGGEYNSWKNKELTKKLGKAFDHFEVVGKDGLKAGANKAKRSSRTSENQPNKSETVHKSVQQTAKRFCDKFVDSLSQCAETLVKARRARAQTREWSQFAGLRIGRPDISREGDTQSKTV